MVLKYNKHIQCSRQMISNTTILHGVRKFKDMCSSLLPQFFLSYYCYNLPLKSTVHGFTTSSSAVLLANYYWKDCSVAPTNCDCHPLSFLPLCLQRRFQSLQPNRSFFGRNLTRSCQTQSPCPRNPCTPIQSGLPST